MNMLKQSIFLWLFLVDNVFASDHAEHAINWWHLGSAYKDAPALGWLTLTFLIFVYLIVRMVRKPMSLYLETRSKDIRRQIEEGQLALKESQDKLRVYEEKLKSLSQEIENLRASFIEQGQAEQKERRRRTEEMRTRILEEARDTIKANFERSKNRLADEVITKAMVMAEETILLKKRDQVDSHLKDLFIDDLRTSAKEVH